MTPLPMSIYSVTGDIKDANKYMLNDMRQYAKDETERLAAELERLEREMVAATLRIDNDAIELAALKGQQCSTCGSANTYITHTCNECGQKIDSVDVRGAQERKPLSIAEVEQILARWDYDTHGDRARFIVRETEAAHGITE